MTDVKALVEGISDLPTLPDVVAKLNRMITDPSTSAADINDVISRDVSLSAKILKLVNSPYYGFSRRITTITYAVVILGFNAVRNLALSAFIFDAFKKKTADEFDLKAFWRHSIGTAFASSIIAKRSPVGISDDDAFMAGLLHGVGKVVMHQHLHDDLATVMRVVNETDCLFCDAERKVLDYNHAELGGLLLERWNLPPHIVDAVRYYNEPGEAKALPEMTAAVHFGNILLRSLCFGSPGDRRVPVLDEAAFARLQFSWNDVDQLMAQLIGDLQRADEFFALT